MLDEIKVQKSAPAPITPPRIAIILEENDAIPPTGLMVGLNGKMWLLCPGERVEVPPGIVEILDHAVEDMAQKNPQTNQVMGYRKKLRFSYRVVK